MVWFSQCEVSVVFPQPAIPDMANNGILDESQESSMSFSTSLPCISLVTGGRFR